MALKFNPNPTFRLIVSVPVAGLEKPEDIPLTVKHLKPSEYLQLVKKAGEDVEKAKDDQGKQLSAMTNAILSLVTAWEWTDEGVNVDVPLTAENMINVLENYPAFYLAVVNQYGEELYKVREKN